MKNLKYSLVLTGLFVLLANEMMFGQMMEILCPEAKIYENHNQVDYGPLKLSIIQGWGIVGRYEDSDGVPADGACLSLFSEPDKKWIETKVASTEGKFRFDSVKPGRYRLVARVPSHCPANIPIVVIKPSRGKRAESMHLLIQFQLKGLMDGCSFGELVNK
jgi:hypothetical protein